MAWGERKLGTGMTAEGMAGGTAGGRVGGTGGTGGTLVVLGTFLVGTFQCTVAAASLNSWAGI